MCIDAGRPSAVVVRLQNRYAGLGIHQATYRGPHRRLRQKVTEYCLEQRLIQGAVIVMLTQTGGSVTNALREKFVRFGQRFSSG